MRDVAIIGAGPAGSSCAAFCAREGLDAVVVERAAFPRHKVCGDCLNPSCWEIFDALDLSDTLLRAEHTELSSVTLEASTGRSVTVPLPPPPRGEIAIKRSLLDDLLLKRAVALGATVLTETPLDRIERVHENGAGAWLLRAAGSHEIKARYLVAADGRNSTVARLLGYGGRKRPERVAFQTHLPLPDDMRGRVLLKVLPQGYCGANPVNDTELNLCLVSRPDTIPGIKDWAEQTFGVSPDHKWHSITPLQRDDRDPAPEPYLFFIGDAARVVEPFTGEGMYYGMRTGELAAAAIAKMRPERADAREVLAAFRRQYHDLYRDRLWVNRLTRLAVTNPRIGNAMITMGTAMPSLLPYLTSKVIRTTPPRKNPA